MDKIRALFIFEILGRPPEYIKESLESLITNLGQEKGIEIASKKIHEPHVCDKEGAKDLYTSFAEVELFADNLSLVFSIVFNMLPSHVEIIEPEELRLKNFELSGVLSELAIKMHKYDEIAKILTLEKNSLINQIRILQESIRKGIKVEEVKKEETHKKEEKKNKKYKKKK